VSVLHEGARAPGGLERIEPNVLAGNQGAPRLYGPLGDQETFVTMAKDIE
jgi:hypothetical protein